MVSEKPSRSSSSLTTVIIEQSAETRSTGDRTGRRVVVARRRRRHDDLASEPLVVALGQVVPHKLLEQVTQVMLAENDEGVQALGSDTFYEPFRMGAVGLCAGIGTQVTPPVSSSAVHAWVNTGSRSWIR